MENNPKPQSSRLDWSATRPAVDDESGPEFKGKFLVCVRQTMVYDECESRFVLHSTPEKPFKELEKDKYVLFSRN